MTATRYTIITDKSGDNGSARWTATVFDAHTNTDSKPVVIDREDMRGTAERLASMMQGASVDDVERELREQIDNADAPKFVFHTADEFDALDLRRTYHIPGILAAGPVPTVMAGSFKTLKTSIVMDMAISLATRSMFLKHFDVSSITSVAIMSGESGGFALQSLARRIAHAKGWTMRAIGDRLRICTSVPSLGDGRDIERIERIIVENGVKLFILDPAYLAMQGIRNDDAGSLFAMGAFLEPLARLGERTDCTPVIVHHNSRGATRMNPGEPAELADIAWSGFAEWAGQWLLLARRERYDPDSNGEHRLWLTAGGRDGHSNLVGVNVVEGRSDDPMGRRWEVDVEQANSVRREAVEAEQDRREQDRRARLAKQTELDREAVLAVIRELPDGDTKSAIRDRSGIRGERFNPVFAGLLAERLIVPRQIKKANGRDYEGYAMPHSDALGRTRTDPDKSGASECTARTRTDSPIGGSPSAGVHVCDVRVSAESVKASEC